MLGGYDDGGRVEAGARNPGRAKAGFGVLLELDHAPFGCVEMVNMINTAKSRSYRFQETEKFCLLKKMIGKKVEISLRLFDIFQRKMVFIFI